MTAQATTITIYLGEFSGRDYIFALDPAAAKKLVESSWRFGDPAESEDALSDQWAKAEGDDGWRIREVKVAALLIPVQLLLEEGTGHVAWRCPECQVAYSDDWLSGDTLPILLSCGCSERSKYLVGDGERPPA